MRRTMLALILSTLLFGCSDDSNNDKVDGAVPKDTGPTQCGKGIYPCGPYGIKTGKVADNIALKGYMAAKNFCTDHKDKKADTSKLVSIAFKDYHLGDSSASCSKNKPALMWVMVSAGWCNPCKTEVQEMQKDYAAGSVDARVGMLNIVYETTAPGTAVTEAFLKPWTDNFKLTLPVAMDPSFKMGAYFSRDNAPFNMLVDTADMKIYYQQQGGKLADIKKKVSEFLAKK